jgi:hypothetical protein
MSDVEHVAFYDDVSRFFTWSPQCAEVRAEPYFVSFLATDQGNIPLTDVETVRIQVVAPAVENPEATAAGGQMNLSWDLTPCYSAFDAGELDDVRYLIYRRNGLFGFEPESCELGVPAYTGYSFMDNETFEQITVAENLVNAPQFLKDGQEVTVFTNGETDMPISVELPDKIEVLVTYSEPGMKGDTATKTLKPATIETGATVNVPLFVNEGEYIRVHSKTGEYVERVK